MDTANATTTPAWYSWVPLLGIQYSPCRSLWWTWRTCAKGESSHIAKRCFWNTIDAKRGFLALKWKSCTSSNTNRAFFAKKIRNDFTTYILQSYKVSSNHQTKIPLAHLAFFLKKYVLPPSPPPTWLASAAGSQRSRPGCRRSPARPGWPGCRSPPRTRTWRRGRTWRRRRPSGWSPQLSWLQTMQINEY